MKKIGLILLIILIILVGYLYLKPTEPSGQEVLNRDRDLPSHPVRSLKHWQKLNKENPEKNPEVFNLSNHEGVAFFAGPFRLEISLTSKNFIGVYIDNQKNQPTLPKNTKNFKIKFNQKEETPLMVYDNGLIVGKKKTKTTLPIKFRLTGLIGGKPVSLDGEIKSYRQKPIIKKGKRHE